MRIGHGISGAAHADSGAARAGMCASTGGRAPRGALCLLALLLAMGAACEPVAAAGPQEQTAGADVVYTYALPAMAGAKAEKLTIAGKKPEDATPIRNPFYDHPLWRLWFRDDSPITVSLDSEQTAFSVPRQDAQKDCYMSLDHGHSQLVPRWSTNCLRAPDFYDPIRMAPPELLRIFGVNFTSESLASRGRYIVDDYENNDRTERDFFFANCVRASCAFISYNDVDPERTYDEYDGLFAHSFQSIGHSGSMMGAIKKMVDAGECIPRATREKLKVNGLYAPAMITLFRAALPFVDARGQPVPYENELRHRPVYSMTGDCMWYADRWFKANVAYHTYDEKLHAQTMIDMARRMEAPPPVAVVDLTGITVTQGGATLVKDQPKDERLKSVNKTVLRVWGKDGETIALEVDMRKSIDLLDRPLSYHAHVLYPNQQNVTIAEGPNKGTFRITARHDPKLPKGRIPVILWVGNGAELPSNPVFVNFYWPSAGETQADYPHQPSSYQSLIPASIRINDNRRPVVALEPPADGGDTVRCAPGTRVSFRVVATDPEGYATTIYRWPGEIGTLTKDQFTCEIPASGYKAEYPLHFIVSDGTGGFTGKLVKIVPGVRSAR